MVRCLLIDTNAAERKRIGQILADFGIACSERDDAEDGIKYCFEMGPGLVVMEASGQREASSFLRKVRSARRSPVVILYAKQPNPSMVGRMILEGAADFLAQPFDGETLRFKLEQAGALTH